MWGPLFEKAWSKIKGNYAAAAGGFAQTGLTTFVGAPIFTYEGSDITTTE